jgi:CheY-like chemotaxis protein
MSSTSIPKPRLILVVEDEVLIRMTNVVALEDAGFTALEAEHADAALKHLQSRASDILLVFTDVHMPGEMNGIALAHYASRIWPWVHLVVTSGKAYPLDGELPRGARFLPKPYELETLVSHVRELADA